MTVYLSLNKAIKGDSPQLGPVACNAADLWKEKCLLQDRYRKHKAPHLKKPARFSGVFSISAPDNRRELLIIGSGYLEI